MSTKNKQAAALLTRAGVTAFRRVGKVRMIYDPQTPTETIAAALEVVRRVTRHVPDSWDEVPGYDVADAKARGLFVADVCDDPCPPDVKPDECPVEWLVERCARYHFRVAAAPPEGIAFEGTDGWTVKDVVPLLPGWFAEACKTRRAEIVAHVNTARDPSPAPAAPEPVSDPEEEPCAVCGRITDAEDRDVLATNHYLCELTTCPSKVAAQRTASRRTAA